MGSAGTTSSGILSEGDKRDSKHGVASRDFAPKPAPGLGPGEFTVASVAIKTLWLEGACVVGWDGHVFLECKQIHSKKPTETLFHGSTPRTWQGGATGSLFWKTRKTSLIPLTTPSLNGVYTVPNV